MNDRRERSTSGEPSSRSGNEGRTDTAAKIDPLAISRHIKQRGPAPVHLWDPPYCGEIDIRIARDGTWYHEGTPIRRDALVKLFSSVLKKEGERFFLVTPVEKIGIQVEDCPFLAHSMELEGSGAAQQITLTLNTDERVRVDRQHPITVSRVPGSEEPHPVVLVRDGLQALLSRNVFYQLVELAEAREEGQGTRLGVWSNGGFFELGSYVE